MVQQQLRKPAVRLGVLGDRPQHGLEGRDLRIDVACGARAGREAPPSFGAAGLGLGVAAKMGSSLGLAVEAPEQVGESFVRLRIVGLQPQQPPPGLDFGRRLACRAQGGGERAAD